LSDFYRHEPCAELLELELLVSEVLVMNAVFFPKAIEGFKIILCLYEKKL
jgi:hypothetical protein